jgi:hypothetical protein
MSLATSREESGAQFTPAALASPARTISVRRWRSGRSEQVRAVHGCPNQAVKLIENWLAAGSMCDRGRMSPHFYKQREGGPPSKNTSADANLGVLHRLLKPELRGLDVAARPANKCGERKHPGHRVKIQSSGQRATRDSGQVAVKMD